MNQVMMFPMPEAGDPDDVVLALKAGSALWGDGNGEEAVRWLRRAAESAEQAGNDTRAFALARAAAELSETMGPAAARPVIGSQPPPPKRSFAPPMSRPPLPRPGAPVGPSQPPLRTQSRPPPSFPPPAAGAARPASSTPPPPPVRAPATASPAASPSAPPAALRPSAAPATAPASQQRAANAAPSGAVTGLRPDGHTVLRVAVKSSSQDERMLIVHVLSEDETPRPGYHEALVVLTDTTFPLE